MTKKIDLSEVKSMFNNAPVTEVALDELELHAGTQQRSKENKEAREAYEAAMGAGEIENFPPLRVVKLKESVFLEDGSTLQEGALVLVDGFTRFDAAENTGHEKFRCEIVEGFLDEAIKFSYVANSMHGAKLDQKDYQELIAKLYTEDPTIKKGDLARDLGCSAKTVSKALSDVEAGFKQMARTMMHAGYSDKEIATKVAKTEQTIKNWRGAYEEEKAQPEPEPKKVNPMKLKFEDVLALDDIEQQQSLFEMLKQRIEANLKESEDNAPEAPREVPEVEQPNDTTDIPETSKEATEEPEQAPWDTEEAQPEPGVTPEVDLSDHWAIMGRDKEQTLGLANPKASLRRELRKLSASGDLDPDTYQAAFDACVAEINK